MLIKIPFEKNLLLLLIYEWTLHVGAGHRTQNMIEDPRRVPDILVRVHQELVLRNKINMQGLSRITKLPGNLSCSPSYVPNSYRTRTKHPSWVPCWSPWHSALSIKSVISVLFFIKFFQHECYFCLIFGLVLSLSLTSSISSDARFSLALMKCLITSSKYSQCNNSCPDESRSNPWSTHLCSTRNFHQVEEVSPWRWRYVKLTISRISHPIAPVEVLLSNLDIPEIVLNEKINVFAIW